MSIAQKLTTIAENEQKVYDAGKQAEWSEFWDELQKNGERTGYSYFFKNWTDAIFFPKYDIVVVGEAVQLFYATSIKNIKQRLNECGVKLDLSQATKGNSAFSYNFELEELPALDLSNMTDANSILRDCKVMHTIDKIILANDKPNILFTNWFTNCNALENIVFEGVIYNNLDMRWSTKLTHDSLISIINALNDYSTDTSGTTYKLTIGSDNIAKLTEEEIKIIRDKGWDYA